jgi:hypothetical protein
MKTNKGSDNMNAKRMALALAIAAGLLGVSCGKSVNVSASDPIKQINSGDDDGGGPGDGHGAPLSCAPEQLREWIFKQPEGGSERVVDILFVVDTSPSMDDEACKIAATIPAFISRLAPGTDYRIAVMLAHGNSSPFSGRLYRGFRGNAPTVLRSSQMSVPQIQAALKQRLLDANQQIDHDEANGEAGMYSLVHGTSRDYLKKSQALGFFRPGAALSVVFLEDENDLCYRPELNGYSKFPDYVPSRGGLEEQAYDWYCKRPGQGPGSYPSYLYSRLVKLKGGRPVSLGGIVHVNPAKVPKGDKIEDAIGHGIIELTHKSSNGVLIDIADDSYESGLAELGNVVQTTLELATRFNLSGTEELDAGSVRVSVDSRAVASQFDADARAVEIALADAGHGGSTVEVAACVADVVPEPTPTPTVTPTPSPSHTPPPPS